MGKIEAIIFDMDGVIIDSEPFWKRAEKRVFASVGVEVSEELCRITASMTTSDVTKFWFEQQPWRNKTLEDVENEVIEYVKHLIEKEGTAIRGIERIIKQLTHRGYKTGLATNSPYLLIPVVLKKLKLENYFDAVSSAEHELEGKPNPSVYLSVAKKLNVRPESCIAIEDSCSGLEAAKHAGMKTIAIVKDDCNDHLKYEFADAKINDYTEFDFSLIS
ncbi:MAG: hexitol phosphatase HxpB [Cytophagales bacterium]|nr:hexitol phosphatase HxpB [Cytophagales bacterium]